MCESLRGNRVLPISFGRAPCQPNVLQRKTTSERPPKPKFGIAFVHAIALRITMTCATLGQSYTMNSKMNFSTTISDAVRTCLTDTQMAPKLCIHHIGGQAALRLHKGNQTCQQRGLDGSQSSICDAKRIL